MGICMGWSWARRETAARRKRRAGTACRAPTRTTFVILRTWGAACCAPTTARDGKSRSCGRRAEQAPPLQDHRACEEDLGIELRVVVMMLLDDGGILGCGGFLLLLEANDFVVLVVGEHAD